MTPPRAAARRQAGGRRGAPDGARVYVTSPEGGFVSVIDARRAARRKSHRARAALRRRGRARRPCDLCRRHERPRSAEIDPRQRPAARPRSAPCPPASRSRPTAPIVVSAPATTTRLSSSTRRHLAKSRDHRRRPASLWPGDRRGGSRAYCANVESDDLSVVDLRSAKARREREGREAAPMAWRSRAAASSPPINMTRRSAFSTRRALAPLRRDQGRRISGKPRRPADGGTRIYVTNWFSNELWAIDAETLKIMGKAPTGEGPRGFGAFVRVVDPPRP